MTVHAIITLKFRKIKEQYMPCTTNNILYIFFFTCIIEKGEGAQCCMQKDSQENIIDQQLLQLEQLKNKQDQQLKQCLQNQQLHLTDIRSFQKMLHQITKSLENEINITRLLYQLKREIEQFSLELMELNIQDGILYTHSVKFKLEFILNLRKFNINFIEDAQENNPPIPINDATKKLIIQMNATKDLLMTMLLDSIDMLNAYLVTQ